MAGDIGDILSISNSIDLGRLQSDLAANQAAQLKLAEFRERADTLARQTGVAPVGFFAYEKANPTPTEHRASSKWWCALVGAAFGCLFITVTAGTSLLIGALAGFTYGAIFNAEPETARLERAINRYDGYLTTAETIAHSQARAQMVDFGGHGHQRTDHAQTVLADREAAAATAPTIH